MDDNQFMGLRIKLENGELANSARQSIRGAPDTLVEDACMTISSWGSEKKWRMENWLTVLGIQFVGLQTRWWRMHE